MKRPALLLAVALLLLSFVLISYRILWLGYPISPTVQVKAWQLSMDARIKTGGKETTVMIGVPYNHPKQIVAEERITSGKFIFNLIREGPNQIGIWAGTIGEGEEVISYRTTIYLLPQRSSKTEPPPLGTYPAGVGSAEQTLAKRLVKNWSPLPPLTRLQRVAAAVAGIWGTPSPVEKDIQAWSAFQEKHGRRMASLVLLRAVDLPTRVAEGLMLEQGVTTATLTWIEVWTGHEWESLQPETGEIYQKPAPLLLLTTDGLPAVRIFHGEVSEIRWILSRQVLSQWRMHFERIVRSNRLLDRWSLFRLPPDFQRTFRILLIVESFINIFTFKFICGIKVSKNKGGNQYATNEPESQVDFKQRATRRVTKDRTITKGSH